ncbi:MAG: type II secretion system secretin GspD [Gammaproteobacteria bacterium]|jgi:general secretion pathway protein D
MVITQRIGELGRALGLLAFFLWFAAAPSARAEELMLNLRDADIEAVIMTVSEMTGKNFIVDPRVKGKVTIVSSEPLDAEALYQTFLAVLEVHGFAAVPADGVVKILPAISARESGGLVASSGEPGFGDEYVTRVIHVNNLNVLELVPILRPLLPQAGHMAGLARSNVLVVSGTAANIARLYQIVQRIDRRDDEEVEVIRLSHASSSEIVRIMQSLDASDKGDVNRVSIVADERTNSVLLSGAKLPRLRYRTIIAHLDTPLESSGNVEVIYLNYAKAKDLAPILLGVSQGIQEDTSGAKGQGKPGERVHIEADENSNALIINAPPDVLGSLKSVVRKLDFRPAQIHVEAVIAEVTTETANELGVQWGIADSDQESVGGLINFGGSGSGIIDIGQALQGGALPSNVDGLTIGVGSLTGSINIVAVIRALAADADNNILSTPSLTTLDNQEAEIVVGREVPFITGSFTSTGSGSNPTDPFQTYERKDVGLTLKVQPQINEGNSVILKIYQEVSSIASTTSGAEDLVTNKRSVTTSVLVDDGQMIVLAGLIDEALRDSEQKVPLLGDIPGLGQLFRYNKAETVKTNLMVFLRPTIVHNAGDIASIVDGKYSYMRNQQLQAGRRGNEQFNRDSVPVLPDPDSPVLAPAAQSVVQPPPPADTPHVENNYEELMNY